ncbi:hypothetical protein VULLAG_LOCUS17044 [Vulpes lagopus]
MGDPPPPPSQGITWTDVHGSRWDPLHPGQHSPPAEARGPRGREGGEGDACGEPRAGRTTWRGRPPRAGPGSRAPPAGGIPSPARPRPRTNQEAAGT